MVETFDDMYESDPQHGLDHKDETYIYQRIVIAWKIRPYGRN
jgi:hypothetical protein